MAIALRWIGENVDGLKKILAGCSLQPLLHNSALWPHHRCLLNYFIINDAIFFDIIIHNAVITKPASHLIEKKQKCEVDNKIILLFAEMDAISINTRESKFYSSNPGVSSNKRYSAHFFRRQSCFSWIHFELSGTKILRLYFIFIMLLYCFPRTICFHPNSKELMKIKSCLYGSSFSIFPDSTSILLFVH